MGFENFKFWLFDMNSVWKSDLLILKRIVRKWKKVDVFVKNIKLFVGFF